MINIKRYSCAVNCQYGSADEDAEGDFVRFDDVRELLERIQELEKNYADISAADHDRAIAEKVRERCADACFGIEDEEKIRNLSIEELLK